MGNQTFCNCVSLHLKPEKTIELEKIIQNVEKGTNLGSMNNSNSPVKKNWNNKDEQTNSISLRKSKTNNENEINTNNNNNKSILIENKDSKNQLVLNNKNNYDTLENNVSLSLIDIESKREQNLQKFGFDIKGHITKCYEYNNPFLSFVKINKKK